MRGYSVTFLPLAFLGTVRAATQAPPPAIFQANPTVGGGGGSSFKDSAHFRVYGASESAASAALQELEGAYACFVGKLGWRSSGLSRNSAADSGPFMKMNIYSVGSLGSAAGQMFSDAKSGFSYLKVISRSLADPKVTVHEYGHALTYHERNWVDMKRTGAWWETVANWVADTYMTSPLCEQARKEFNQPEGKTIIELGKLISSSHQVLVDASSGSGNYYQAWPFLTYLHNNPDNFKGLGPTALREMFRQYKVRSNETPLHALQTVVGAGNVQKVVGRYWARMAYVDIGHRQAQNLFNSGRSRFNYANLESAGAGSYRVKGGRAPKYMGASIVPLKGSGQISVKVTANSPFTATLAVKGKSTVRYVDLPKGSGGTSLSAGEEASLVVANTPDLVLYDGFSITGEVAKALNYQVQLTGATA